MGKYLEALKLLYGDDEKTSETPKARTDKTDRRAFVSNVSASSGGFDEILPEYDENQIPFTDHEIAEHLINTEVHRDDRPFVRQQLIGAYGTERLIRVDGYLEQFRIGAESVTEPHKKSNAGRRRANTWLRHMKTNGNIEKRI
jgi:hypothetical protein